MNRAMSYRSPKTEIRDSPIHGRGLFAKEAIAREEIVAIKGGCIFDGAALREIGRSLGPAEIQVAEDLFIGPVSQQDRHGAMLYLNHSCEPNIGINGQIVFVAMRPIEAGEELTHDWATTDDDDFSMTCRCGTRTCRGTVTGQDWRKPELQAKYRGYFAWHLERKIGDGSRRES